MTTHLVEPNWLPGLHKTRLAHKYSHGHAAVLSGDLGKGGAARLAARAALRVGAGAVTLLCPPEALGENAARLEALMLDTCGSARELHSHLSDPRLSAVLLGPSLGLTSDKTGLVAAAIAGSSSRGLVLDADAITHLARDSSLQTALHEGCVLTPHMGEFSRLCPEIAARLDAPARCVPVYSKLDATQDAARALGSTVVLKGPDTVVATPDGQVALHAACYERAVPWLATAGAGDVLAGIICGLLARRYTPFHAACWGVWLHAECAIAFGPGLTADDLPDMLPRVLAQVIAQG